MNLQYYQNGNLQNMLAERIGGKEYGLTPHIYKFEKIKRAKQIAKQIHPNVELIDMGVGEPDEMAAAGIVNKLAEEAAKSENRGYADNGIPDFKKAAVRYLQKVFDVKDIHWETEVLHTIGAKSALSMLPQVFINPGDVTIMTVPGYPILGTHTKYLGGEVYNLKLIKENNFLPDLNSVPKEITTRAKLLYLNYPNNPTGATATKDFFEQVVAWAKKHEIFVVHDAPYAALTYDGTKPLSFLSVPGAKEIGVEIHSLSKAYNMTGWRIAFIAGNPLIIKAFGDIKDNSDSGQFIAIQKAAIYALNHPEITESIVEKYNRRHNNLALALQQVGFKAAKPPGTFFMYVEVPKGIVGGEIFSNAEDFSQYLIRDKLISTVPWDDSGHFVRFSVTFHAPTEEEEMRVIHELKRRLSSVQFYF